MNSRGIERKARRTGRQRGFTLTELAIATVLLVAGSVAVMQLVPAAIQSNMTNRYDTTSTVVIQRLRDLMVSQPINSNTLTDPSSTFPCGTTVTCSLGDPTKNDQVVGSPLNGTGEIDFGAGRVTGYSFTFIDPNDPSQSPYDVRWAVVTSVRNVGNLTNVVVAKRIIVGARRASVYPVTVNFTTWMSR